LLPYTERSRQNLLQEGFPSDRVHVIGNPIYEVIRHHESEIERSGIMRSLGLETKSYFLVTMHRAENVDVEDRLRSLAESLEQVQREFGVRIVCSLHPHTRRRMEQFCVAINNNQILMLDPLSFFDFIKLERNASCVLTDSGTVQEECCIFKIPTVTVRDTTERPETLECGSNILSGVKPPDISRCVHAVLSRRNSWQPPPEYLRENVSNTVVRLLLGEQPLRQWQKRAKT
jgi:UDP-N-acetylglucosamine 2-epimerase (non-hydrolysing)